MSKKRDTCRQDSNLIRRHCFRKERYIQRISYVYAQIYIYMMFRTELGLLDLIKDIYCCKQNKDKEKYVCNTQDFMLGNSKPLVKCSQTLVHAR